LLNKPLNRPLTRGRGEPNASRFPNRDHRAGQPERALTLIPRGHGEGFGLLPVHFCQIENREQEKAHPEDLQCLKLDPEHKVIDQNGRQRESELRQRRDGGLRVREALVLNKQTDHAGSNGDDDDVEPGFGGNGAEGGEGFLVGVHPQQKDEGEQEPERGHGLEARAGEHVFSQHGARAPQSGGGQRQRHAHEIRIERLPFKQLRRQVGEGNDVGPGDCDPRPQPEARPELFFQ
jgi:hypothetical protein